MTRLNYYGKVFNPELSNMMILTAGVGMRPTQNLSVDLNYHHFQQVKASNKLRDTDVDDKPNAVDRNLGSELDLVVGLRKWRNMTLEGVYGVFYPGAAFSGSSGKSQHLELVLKSKF